MPTATIIPEMWIITNMKAASSFEARFTKCGICVLMKELGLYDLTSFLCRLDYTMNEAENASTFVRKFTLPPEIRIATADIKREDKQKIAG